MPSPDSLGADRGRPLIDIAALEYGRAGTGFRLSVPGFRLGRGQAIGIVGASGSGKSTFLDLLALLRRPSRVGRFQLGGLDVSRLWARGGRSTTAVRGAHIGYVLQTGGLLPYLTVSENILLPQRLSGALDRPWLQELLATLGLAPLASRLPAQLSLGERQRVAVARAISHRPALVLADEPTAALDADNGALVVRSLLDLGQRCGSGVVLVSHDQALLDQFEIAKVRCLRQAGVAAIAWTGGLAQESRVKAAR